MPNIPYSNRYDDLIKITTHEVCFEINGRPIYVRIFDPYDNLSNRQIKSKAWKYIKESARIEVRRNI